MREIGDSHSFDGVMIPKGKGLKEHPIFAPVLRWIRAGKRTVVGLAHPFRRRSLRRRLASASVDRVLVLCLGNICRSPYGAARLGALGQGNRRLEVRSAGLMGPGRPSPENAQTAASRKGLDLGPHRSQLLTGEMAGWADALLVMTPQQAKVVRREFGVPRRRVVMLGDLDPEIPDRRDIPDPVDRSEEYFLETYDRIDRCLREFHILIRDSN